MKSSPRLTNKQRATFAFEVHAALLRAELREPKLKENPLWVMVRQDSLEEFYVTMDKL